MSSQYIVVDPLADMAVGDGEAHDTEARSARCGGSLVAASNESGTALDEMVSLLARALLAKAEEDELAYRDFGERFRTMATALGAEGFIASASAMT